MKNSVLDTLSYTPDDQFSAVFDELYSPLILILQSEVLEDHAKTISIIKRFIQLQCRSLDSDLLTRFARVSKDLKHFYVENITKIDLLVLEKWSESSSLDKYCAIINENFETLSCIQTVFQKVGLHNLPIADIHTVASDAMVILSGTFKHCRDQRQFYADASSVINKSINNLFRKCNEVLFQCLDSINSMKIDCNNGANVKLLNGVLLLMFDMGTVVSNLELKTMAQLWKCFTSLLQTYAIALHDQFNVCQAIRYFCTEINEKMVTIYETSTKTRTVTLKILNFLLKIVIKICESFSGYLKTCLIDLCQLVFLLYRNSSLCTKYVAYWNSEVSGEIERSLLVAIDPLIVMLIKEEGFVEHFLKLNLKKTTTSNSITKLLLLSVMLQKLVLSPADTRYLWLNRGLIEIVFENISAHITELYFDVRIPVPSVSLQLPHDIFLYDALIVHFACLIICTVSQSDFFYVESLLISNLLRSAVLMKLFICDLWCVIARYGNSELCFEHTTLILTILRLLQNEKNEFVIIKSLLKRFFKFLSRCQQQKIVNLLNNDRSMLLEFCHHKIDEALFVSHDLFLAEIRERSYQLSNLCSSIKTQDVDLLRMIESTCKINEKNATFDQEVNRYIHSIWVQLQEAHPHDPLVFLHCTHHLCTSSKLFQVRHVTTLPIIEKFLFSGSIFLKLVALDYLRYLGHRTADEMCPNKFTSLLASFFRSLLIDENVLIRERALETFSYFSHVTMYEKVIQITIANEPQVAVDVTNFLQNKVNLLSSRKTCDDFLKNLIDQQQTDTVPKHPNRIENSEMDSDNRQVKKIKLNFDFENEIVEIESRIRTLLCNISAAELNLNQKNTLKRIVEIADELREYF